MIGYQIFHSATFDAEFFSSRFLRCTIWRRSPQQYSCIYDKMKEETAVAQGQCWRLLHHRLYAECGRGLLVHNCTLTVGKPYVQKFGPFFLFPVENVCKYARVSKHRITLTWATAKINVQNMANREYVEAYWRTAFAAPFVGCTISIQIVHAFDTLANKDSVSEVGAGKKVQALKTKFRKKHRKLAVSKESGTSPKMVASFWHEK